MELCLHQVRGRAAPLTVTLRQCTREEAETVYRLQNEVRAMMPNPELFMPDTLENIQSYLEHDLCLGAWDGERLVCCQIDVKTGMTQLLQENQKYNLSFLC